MKPVFQHTLFIIYVADQNISRNFYTALLQTSPTLDVPGMTEFTLSDTCKLGLMPNRGIAKILGSHLPHPDTGTGIPRCEIYLTVADIQAVFEHAVACGAKIISAPENRDWGHCVCYLTDPDGHVIAFAREIQ
ncbi:MAG: VOC family protein [Bacteroidetes bacterium]|nr:VOC family protein [Bacteroidota bacterium]